MSSSNVKVINVIPWPSGGWSNVCSSIVIEKMHGNVLRNCTVVEANYRVPNNELLFCSNVVTLIKLATN